MAVTMKNLYDKDKFFLSTDESSGSIQHIGIQGLETFLSNFYDIHMTAAIHDPQWNLFVLMMDEILNLHHSQQHLL